MTAKLFATLGILTAAAAVAPAEAQERRPARARIWVDGQEVRPFDLIASRRARLGVVLDMRAAKNDSIGATIASVSPGGPAADAGLRSGDIITRLNGRALAHMDRDRDADAEESLAALQLVEMVARLEPGDTVAIEYRRDAERRTAKAVTARERDIVFRGFDWPEGSDSEARVRFRELPRIAAGPGEVFFRFGGPLARVEFAPLNDDLGAYFGTAEGVLVIDAPSGNEFGLKGGDVILSVDGRKARAPSALLRILSTYEEGDVVKLEILRNRNRLTVSSKIQRAGRE